MSVRMTVRIDDGLMARIRHLAPSRGFSRFVNEALAARVERLECDQPERVCLEQEMAEGYLTTREDREELSRDWGD